MNKKHLWWIIPITFAVAFFIGSYIMASGTAIIAEDYPVIGCIQSLDMQLNPLTNKMPFTVESQQAAIQWRCAREYVNFELKNYEDLFVFEE